MNTLIGYINKFPWWTKNIYFLIVFTFFIWMLIFDRNSIISNHKTENKLETLIEQKEYYISEIAKVDKLKEELFSTEERIEKFAREKYLMKKDNEDIFIIQ